MLSYRHAFHAGNHADVLKHAIQVGLLSYMGQKDKPYWYVDTHAGAGLYALESGFAAKNAEYRSGISVLWNASDLPELLTEYRDLVCSINPDGALRYYPGSPLVAQKLVRAEDRLKLFELHPADVELLAQNFRDTGKLAQITRQDGFAGLKAVLPPQPRRGITLIDPPYEDKKDYKRVVEACEEALRRFETGTIAIWYPLLQRPEPSQMRKALRNLPLKSWLDVTLSVHAPRPDGFGMHGSGMFVINPPWTLPKLLKESLPWLQKNLAQDKGAQFELDFVIP